MPARPESGTVYVIDDDDDVRDSLAMLIRSNGLEVATFRSGIDFLEADLDPGPACVLLDLLMPDLDGLAVQAALAERGSKLPVIFLSAHGRVPHAVRAVQRGALNFLEKPNFDATTLLNLLYAALRRHRHTLNNDRVQAQRQQRIGRLTGRELEVARLAASGKTNKAIAAELGISERTVEIHRGRAMRKLELRSVADLVRLEGELQSATTSAATP